MSVKLFQPSAGCRPPLPESPFQVSLTSEGSLRPCQAVASRAGCAAAWQALLGGLQDALPLHRGTITVFSDRETELK